MSLMPQSHSLFFFFIFFERSPKHRQIVKWPVLTTERLHIPYPCRLFKPLRVILKISRIAKNDAKKVKSVNLGESVK